MSNEMSKGLFRIGGIVLIIVSLIIGTQVGNSNIKILWYLNLYLFGILFYLWTYSKYWGDENE